MATARLFEVLYDLTEVVMKPLIGWIQPDTPMAKAIAGLEVLSKKPLFNCQMCGQCILHSTGMVCPMNCPKNLRNGPCGGVRENGHCEVKPEMRCVWVRAYEGSQQLSRYQDEITILQPPVNHRLHNTSSWVNMFQGRDQTEIDNWFQPAQTEEVNDER